MLDIATDLPQSTAAGRHLRLRNVRQVFQGNIVAVDSMDLDVPSGQFVAILGPSGCGKSTLLRLIAGLDRPVTGSITLTGRSTAGEQAPEMSSGALRDRAEIAYVFQDAHLLPWRTLLDNVALPLELRHVERSKRLATARQVIDRVGLMDAVQRYPAQLSGGMRMRASLARALVIDPSLLLLDEPFAALDEITRQRLDEQLRALWLERRMTVVFVTHSTTEAVFLAERAIVLSSRPARIVADQPIDLPPRRTGAMRATEAFARQTRFIYEALERGEQ